jgi:acyl-homoserine lactone acylase PvdQ
MGERQHTFQYTKNGALLEPFQGEATKLVLWFYPKYTFADPQSDKRYSFKWSYSAYDFDVNVASTYKHGLEQISGKLFVEYVGRVTVGPINIVFVGANGDYGYAPGVLFPQRKFNVAQGVYPKKGWKAESGWMGPVPASELPSVVNP